MPPKLTVNDYTFFLTRNDKGKYRFKNERVNVNRKLNGEFQTMIRTLPEHERNLIIEVWGIASVQNIETTEHTLVYSIFEDLYD